MRSQYENRKNWCARGADVLTDGIVEVVITGGMTLVSYWLIRRMLTTTIAVVAAMAVAFLCGCWQRVDESTLIGSWQWHSNQPKADDPTVVESYARDHTVMMTITTHDGVIVTNHFTWALEGDVLVAVGKGHKEHSRILHLNRTELVLQTADGSVRKFRRVSGAD